MALPTFGNSALRFKLKFDFPANTLSLIDSLGNAYNTSYGFVLLNCKGIAKVISPTGTVIHQNAGYTTNDFSSPDINSAGSWTFSLGNIPVDAQGVALKGTYEVYYKLNNGVSTFTSYVAIPYEFTEPTVNINMTANVVTSILTSADVTNYNVSYNGSLVAPSSKTLLHKITQPEGAGYTFSGTNPEQTTGDTLRMIGGGGTASSDIWTRVWGAYITSDLLYAFGSFGTYPFFEVRVIITGNEYIDIRYDAVAENIYDSITAFINRWLIASGRIQNNPSAVIASRLQPKVIELQSEYQKFLMARELGKDTNLHYQRLIAILNSEGFTFDTDDSPKHIVPVQSGTTTGSSSTFNFGYGASVPTGGVAGNFYLQDTGTDKILWYNASSTWINLGSLKGDAGPSSRTAQMVVRDVTAVPIVATSGETLAVEKNIDVTNFVDGDKIKITVGISTDNANPKVSLYHKLNDVAISTEAQLDMTPNSATDYTMTLELVVDTDAAAATYPLYAWDNEADKGFGRIHTDIIGQTVLNWKLYQNKLDATAVTNFRINFVTVELIPYI